MIDLSSVLTESHESLIYSLGYASNTQKAVEYKRLRTERDQQLLSLFSELGFCFIDAMTIAVTLLPDAFHLSESPPDGCYLEVDDDGEQRLAILLDYPYRGNYANKTRNMYLDADELLYLAEVGELCFQKQNTTKPFAWHSQAKVANFRDHLTIEEERSEGDARHIIGVDETTFGLMKKKLDLFRRCNNFDDLRNDFDPEAAA